MIDILVISHACFTAINRNVYHLFQKSGWKLEIVVPQFLPFPSGIRKADPPQAKDPVIHFLNLEGTNPRIYQFKGLEEILLQANPKIIILDNDPVSRMALQLGKWAKKNNRRLYCISNDNLPLDIFSNISRRGLKALPATIVKRALLSKTRKLLSGVFVINTDGQKIFQKEGYRNVVHMPLGFDPAFFFPDEKSRTEIRAKFGLKGIVIAYFGRLTPEKGIHVLISALQQLKQYEWRLMMDEFDEYASGFHHQIKKQIQDAGLGDRIVFVKPSHFEIPAYMNATDIVVVPSIRIPQWKEQYGRVAAEAMACGKHVIASETGALPELLGGYGDLFEEGNQDQLRDTIKSILEGRQWNKSTSEIANYAKEKLSIQKQYQVMEAVLQ
jgi:glycosyltransferase involved in cell wall biosynthesis